MTVDAVMAKKNLPLSKVILFQFELQTFSVK
jgi:hypothetical protein